MKLTRENLRQLISEAIAKVKENLNEAPTYVLYYRDGSEKTVTLSDKEWHALYDADPEQDPVEVLKLILSPELTQGLEDVERISTSTVLSEGLIPFKQAQDLARDHGVGLSDGHATILGKRFQNTPSGRKDFVKAIRDGSYKSILRGM